MPTRSLPLSSNSDFIPLPSDPRVPFTPEQRAAFFSPNATRILRDVVLSAANDDAFTRRLTPAHPAAASGQPVHQTTPSRAPTLEKAHANVT